MFKRVLGNPRPKSLVRNFVATLVVKRSLVWITSKLTNESILGRNRTNAPAAKNGFKRSQTLIAISRHTTSELASAPSLVVHVGETFHNLAPYNAHIRTAHSTAQPARKRPAAEKKHRHACCQKNLGGRTKQVSLQDQSPRQLLPLVLTGKRIPFLSLQILSQALTRILLRCTDNTGHKFAPDLAAKTDFKTGTIFACPRSVPLLSANNSAASSLIRRLCSRSTCHVDLSSATLKRGLYSTTTPLPTTTWC